MVFNIILIGENLPKVCSDSKFKILIHGHIRFLGILKIRKCPVYEEILLNYFHSDGGTDRSEKLEGRRIETNLVHMKLSYPGDLVLDSWSA